MATKKKTKKAAPNKIAKKTTKTVRDPLSEYLRLKRAPPKKKKKQAKPRVTFSKRTIPRTPVAEGVLEEITISWGGPQTLTLTGFGDGVAIVENTFEIVEPLSVAEMAGTLGGSAPPFVEETEVPKVAEGTASLSMTTEPPPVPPGPASSTP